ncbi:MAG: hypothetical protein DIU52_010870 [bacterium]|jgi:hypothetical protein|nr:MAG: hypothetical protein DIU52_02515 [bacterium]
MVAPNDWRRQGQERYLRGARHEWTEYRAPGPDWDHDHCESRWARFADYDAPDVLRAGYATPDRYRWICADCARDFAEEFGFVLLNAPDSQP